MPQVIQMEICPWLFGTFGETAPGVLDTMSCPLAYGRPVYWKCPPFVVIMESFHSSNFCHENFYVVKQIVTSKQWYLKNAKPMFSCLKHVSNRTHDP